MEALEKFGEEEPLEVVVVFTTQEGHITTMSSTNCISTKVGLLECSKKIQMDYLVEE
jgi:hypothetical protein